MFKVNITELSGKVVVIEHLVLSGDAIDLLQKSLQKKGFDVIVMGAK